MLEVNYLAVLVSAIAAMVIGAIWYGPLFGKQFMQAMGMNQNVAPEQKAAMQASMWKSYVLQFIASFVTFSVLAGFMTLTDKVSTSGGMNTAFMVWIGFFVPFQLGQTIWGGKWTLFWIGIFNMLITLLVGGLIIGAMGI